MRGIVLALAVLLVGFCPCGVCAKRRNVTFHAHAPDPLPHFWEQMFGSGRANLALRDDYRDDLRQ